MEKMLVGVWRRRDTEAGACRAHLLEEWAPVAARQPEVRGLRVSVADVDQGRYARLPGPDGTTPMLDALLSVFLDDVDDIDDIPARDLVYAVARRVDAWAVEERVPKAWDRTWPDGTPAPGFAMVSPMRRREGLTREQFGKHWVEQHTPLALAHHPGLWSYRQNLVIQPLTPGAEEIDGIAELHFASADDFEHRFFDSDEGRRVIMDDVARFMAGPAPETALMSETSFLTPPAS